MSTFEAMVSAVTIGGGIMDLGHVITKTTLRDVFLSGSSHSFIKIKLNSYYEHSLINFANTIVDVSLDLQPRPVP